MVRTPCMFDVTVFSADINISSQEPTFHRAHSRSGREQSRSQRHSLRDLRPDIFEAGCRSPLRLEELRNFRKRLVDPGCWGLLGYYPLRRFGLDKHRRIRPVSGENRACASSYSLWMFAVLVPFSDLVGSPFRSPDWSRVTSPRREYPPDFRWIFANYAT